MGRELDCDAKLFGKKTKGRVYRETHELVFRAADKRTVLKFADFEGVSVEADSLVVRLKDGTQASFELGSDEAAAWVQAITRPKGRIEKLGVKAGQRVSVVGVGDALFLRELRAVIEDIALEKVAKGSDAIFFGVASAKDLNQLAKVKASLKANGALWVIRQKGKDAPVAEAASRAAGRAAGLVDVKVVSFSETHSA
ncbi:MAG: hypothetical protein ACJ790_12400, partial [Myxococcaceae bacterium]